MIHQKENLNEMTARDFDILGRLQALSFVHDDVAVTFEFQLRDNDMYLNSKYIEESYKNYDDEAYTVVTPLVGKRVRLSGSLESKIREGLAKAYNEVRKFRKIINREAAERKLDVAKNAAEFDIEDSEFPRFTIEL